MSPDDRQRALQALADRIASLGPGHPVRVGIDGVTASGKTTLADELSLLIEARNRHVLRATMDDFHRPGSKRYRRGRDSPEGYYHDAFDYLRFVESLLRPLRPDGDRRIAVAGRTQTVGQAAILLVDGVFLFRPELDSHWDYRVFVKVESEIALQRGIRRDASWMGGEAETRRRYETRYVPGERMYLEAVQPEGRADAVLENSEPDAPRLTFRTT